MRSFGFFIEEEYCDKQGITYKRRKKVYENSNHLQGAVRKLYQDMNVPFQIIGIFDPYKQ